MRAFLAFALFLVTSQPAFATASLTCGASDANLVFSAASPVGRGMGGPIINLEAASDILLKDVPSDLAKLDLSKHLVHSWLEGPDIRLHFYREREGNAPHGYVELTIKTVVKEEDGLAEGDYVLTVFSMDAAAGSEGKTLQATGKATCSLE
jgi:hypothetical protein